MKRLLLLVSAAFCLAACNKEIGFDNAYQDKSLVFDVSIGAVSSSPANDMAGTKAMSIHSADGSVSLPLEYRVAEGIASTPMGAEALTKGTQYNSNTSVQTFGTFYVTAWNSDHSKFIPDSTSSTADADTVKYNATTAWTLSSGTNPVWKSADVKTFFAYTNLPSASSVSCAGFASHTFSYPALNTDAANQKDALLGYYKGNGDSDADGVSDGVASIKFIHPLTAVVFKQGVINGVTAIKSISIEGVFDGGTADVSYSYDASGNLTPSFDWGSSLSDTTTVSQTITGILPGAGNQIGESFIIFPQDLSANHVTVKAVVSTSVGGDQTLQAELSSGVWKEGKTNIYTIGCDANNYTYTFTYNDGTTLAKHVFTNTISDSTATSGIISKKVDASGTQSDCNWLIESVQVGSGLIQPIEQTNFSDIENLNVTQPGVASIQVTAAGRESVNSGSHDYWVNQNPNRTDYLDWSPDDWSGNHATSGAPLDLSTFNFQTETFDNPMTTANCYVIRHAGTYKLPLVYGNAVKNGADNSESYFPNVTGGSRRLDRFMNYAGHDIYSPFIENDADVTGELKCQVIWQDKAEVVKSPLIVGTPNLNGTYDINNVRYLQFTVDPNTICQNNAVICIYKDLDNNGYQEGEAIWSWHIWTTNDPALLDGPVPVTNFSGNEYDFFPLYNLGWRDASKYPEREDVSIILRQAESGNRIKLIVKQREVPGASIGCYYEFGRKDPMCPVETPFQGIFNHAVEVDINGNVLDYSTRRLSTAISNPASFYVTEDQSTIQAQEKLGKTDYYSRGWIDDSYFYDNLWTGKYSGIPGDIIEKNSSFIKTIYDPSPAGYMVPAPKAFSGFSTTGITPDDRTQFNVEDDFANGWYMYTCKSSSVTPLTPTIYFPAAGYHRHHKSAAVGGHVWSVGTYGDYWTSVLRTNHAGYRLFFRYASPSSMGMAFSGADCTGFGMSVRPVLE